MIYSWLWCPYGLRPRPAAAWLLESRVRNLLRAWLFDELITRFRVVQPGVYLIVCDLETSTVRRPRPYLGSCTTEGRYDLQVFLIFIICKSKTRTEQLLVFSDSRLVVPEGPIFSIKLFLVSKEAITIFPITIHVVMHSLTYLTIIPLE
jgi:hypothetical protein